MFFRRWRTHPPTIVYTAIIGPYDELHEPTVVCPHCTYVCFTDQALTSRTWNIIPIVMGYENAQRCARRHKILAHTILPPCTYSLWMDGQSTLKTTTDALIAEYLATADMAVFAHPDRDCIYDEAVVCTEWGLDDRSAINRHMTTYRTHGYPPHAGLAATGFLLRRHTPHVAAFNDAWWREFVFFNSRRDQLSFNAICWRLGLSYAVLHGNCFSNAYVQCNGHRQRLVS